MEKKEPTYPVGGNVSWYTHYVEQHRDCLGKLNSELSYDPTIPLLGIYPEKMKTWNSKSTCTNVHSSTIYNSQDMETT